MRLSILAALIALFAVLAAGGATPRAHAAPTITLQQVAAGFTQPVAIANAGDSRLFVAEQTGAIKIISGGGVLPADFLDVSGLISVGSERGLLGLAFHPGYPASPYFYVDYTATSGNVIIARYTVSAGDPNAADPASAVVLKTISHTDFANHNGGQLAFGPDGMLYVGVGDGGSAGDPSNHAQSLSSLLGKILRLNVDIADPYIPADNPFVGTPGAMGEIWAYGLRNPWRFSFDRATGDLIVGDVGQFNWEEVDFQPAASSGGEDYGWRLMEGNHCYNPATACDPGGLTAPILEYDHSADDCAIIGGMRYRGSAPSLAGIYFYSDYCSGRIWGATKNGAVWNSSLLLDTPYFVSAFGEDTAGSLYLADYGDGIVYAILASPPPAVGGYAERPALPPAATTTGTRAPVPVIAAGACAALVMLASILGLELRRRQRATHSSRGRP